VAGAADGAGVWAAAVADISSNNEANAANLLIGKVLGSAGVRRLRKVGV
jgi:hypothetical protein